MTLSGKTRIPERNEENQKQKRKRVFFKTFKPYLYLINTFNLQNTIR